MTYNGELIGQVGSYQDGHIFMIVAIKGQICYVLMADSRISRLSMSFMEKFVNLLD